MLGSLVRKPVRSPWFINRISVSAIFVVTFKFNCDYDYNYRRLCLRQLLRQRLRHDYNYYNYDYWHVAEFVTASRKSFKSISCTSPVPYKLAENMVIVSTVVEGVVVVVVESEKLKHMPVRSPPTNLSPGSEHSLSGLERIGTFQKFQEKRFINVVSLARLAQSKIKELLSP